MVEQSPKIPASIGLNIPRIARRKVKIAVAAQLRAPSARWLFKPKLAVAVSITDL